MAVLSLLDCPVYGHVQLVYARNRRAVEFDGGQVAGCDLCWKSTDGWMYGRFVLLPPAERQIFSFLHFTRKCREKVHEIPGGAFLVIGAIGAKEFDGACVG